MADPLLPVDSVSLEEFCEMAHGIHTDNETDEFVRYTLTGIHHGRQASIDVVRNRIKDDEVDTLSISRDYDSVLGIDKHIRIRNRDITVWPISKFEDSLKRSIHLTYSFSNANGEHVALVHQIPNLCLGKWDLHNSIRILFPDLYAADRKSFHLSPQEQATFYEKGILPTFQALLDARGGDLPPDYQAELFRARQQSGKLALGTRILPADRIEDFGDTLRSNLVSQGVTWAMNFVFLHEIRGVKNTSYHSFDSVNADVALDEFLGKNGLERHTLLYSGEWYIDVGAQVSSRLFECMAWRTDEHHTLVQQVLKIPQQHATRITQISSSKYYRDPASHLIGASGFRITPGVRAQGRYKAQYFQAYLTDKPITSTKEANKFGKFITPEQLLRGKGETYIADLYRLYRQAADQNFSTARFEVRVPINHASEVLLDIDLNVLCRCLLSFPRHVWWAFRAWRALACKYVDDWQRGGDMELRLLEPSLLLTAGISWLLNGLHSTPDDGPSYRELMSATLPRSRRSLVENHELPFPISLTMLEREDDDTDVESEDEDDPRTAVVTRQRLDGEDDDEIESAAVGRALVPYVPYGAFFFRELRKNAPVPRFRAKDIPVSDKCFKFLFGATKDDIMMLFASSKVSIPRHPTRHPNRTRRRLIENPEPEERLNFSLQAQGHDLQPPIRDDGSDIAENDSEDERNDDPLASGLDVQLERVWRQFPKDMVALMPNHRTASECSYCVIPQEEIENVTSSIFQNLNLSDIFEDVQWKIATETQWQRTFDHLWPEKGVKKHGKVQNYPQASYYALWETMTSRMTDETAKEARRAIWHFFKTLEWIPCAGTERIWETKSTPKSFRHGNGVSSNKPAPKIFMQSHTPTWNVQRPRDTL